MSPASGLPKEEFRTPLGGLSDGSLTPILFFKLLSKCWRFQGVMWLLRSVGSRVPVSFILPGKCLELFQIGKW